MRYLPINQLKNDMVLGQELYDAQGHMLLAKHTTLTEENIAYIAFLGVPGVYIDDSFSEEAKVEEIIRPEVKKAALRLIQDVFVHAAEDDVVGSAKENALRKYVNEIVDCVLDNEDVMYNLVAIKTYDDYTFFHSTNVAILSGIIGAKLNMKREALDDLVMAGFLHDIGKVFIDPDIINAPRKLTDEERIQMMDHPRLGYDFLKDEYNFSEDVLEAVYQHHEWFNGDGYPRRLEGVNISRMARILKVADVYDAMTGRRSYHDPYLPSDVLEYIMGRSGMEFDPSIVQVMAMEMCVYPVGCEVGLSDGRRGIILENQRGFIMRPKIKLLGDERVLDLANDREAWNLTIVKLLM
ncbi:MAG: HD-GYP domain-containing protein [Lachnospiraceae bacterium]|nr:HD-GYP domain-containing protein [Lachnospiraceae bacterium]